MRVYPGISAVDLGVLDLEAAVRFYERLGFRRSPWREASTALFQLNTIVLRLHEAPPAAGERGRAQGRDVSLAQYHASAEAVEGALEEAGGAGARLLARPPARRRGDGRRGRVLRSGRPCMGADLRSPSCPGSGRIPQPGLVT